LTSPRIADTDLSFIILAVVVIVVFHLLSSFLWCDSIHSSFNRFKFIGSQVKTPESGIVA
jgi:hypothetical protein